MTWFDIAFVTLGLMFGMVLIDLVRVGYEWLLRHTPNVRIRVLP